MTVFTSLLRGRKRSAALLLLVAGIAFLMMKSFTAELEHLNAMQSQNASFLPSIEQFLAGNSDKAKPKEESLLEVVQIDPNSQVPTASFLSGGLRQSVERLQAMGVNTTGIEDQLPSWSQITENYGNSTIVLGKDQCQKYRTEIWGEDRAIAPVGLFSTGTNLLVELLERNCQKPPTSKRKRPFITWQAPWGKHNPATARLNHTPWTFAGWNHTVVLPVLTVRHPYMWLLSVCRHPYQMAWKHKRDECDKHLFLDQKVRVKFGSGVTKYESPIHAWRDWGSLYLDDFAHRRYPLLIVRHEDLVFRAKDVVKAVCECAGGFLTKNFTYQQSTANKGFGHGQHRNDLNSAWIKYGQSMSDQAAVFNDVDWTIIDSVLRNYTTILDMIGYKHVQK